jgi:hypothetical protein
MFTVVSFHQAGDGEDASCSPYFKNKAMEKKLTHGGARKKSGRKPIDDKKQQVNLFIEGSLIEKHGGKENVQQKCYEFLRGVN